MPAPAPNPLQPLLVSPMLFGETAATAGEAAYLITRETLAAWHCAWSALAEFAAQARTVYDPTQMFEAQMRFMAHFADLGAEAASERLRIGGVDTPLLSDA